jgi:hypothetical protein
MLANTYCARLSVLCTQGGEGRTPKTALALKLPDFRLDVSVVITNNGTAYMYTTAQ